MDAKTEPLVGPAMSNPIRGSRLVPSPSDPMVGPTTPPLGLFGDPLTLPTVVSTPLVESIPNRVVSVAPGKLLEYAAPVTVTPAGVMDVSVAVSVPSLGF